MEVALLAERRARGRDGQRMRFAASTAPWILASMLALRSQVMEAAGARSGVEQPGQSIAGNSARRASCAARRQLERGRAVVSGVRIDASPGKPDFFDASPGTSRTASSPWLVIVIDEFSGARRQDVLTAAPARYA